MQSDNKPPSFEKLISMIREDVEGMTVDGESCPECNEDNDYYGHIELVHLGNHVGLQLTTDCLYCGHSQTGYSRFSDS